MAVVDYAWLVKTVPIKVPHIMGPMHVKSLSRSEFFRWRGLIVWKEDVRSCWKAIANGPPYFKPLSSDEDNILALRLFKFLHLTENED
ncbi:hypothetical protein TNCV_361491 [Trichonephila clavipes]|nr:hypothetical protein TNCV_361491 [Trichonephila clavipes]